MNQLLVIQFTNRFATGLYKMIISPALRIPIFASAHIERCGLLWTFIVFWGDTAGHSVSSEMRLLPVIACFAWRLFCGFQTQFVCHEAGQTCLRTWVLQGTLSTAKSPQKLVPHSPSVSWCTLPPRDLQQDSAPVNHSGEMFGNDTLWSSLPSCPSSLHSPQAVLGSPLQWTLL